jgi:hypothetical protein
MKRMSAPCYTRRWKQPSAPNEHDLGEPPSRSGHIASARYQAKIPRYPTPGLVTPPAETAALTF